MRVLGRMLGFCLGMAFMSMSYGFTTPMIPRGLNAPSLMKTTKTTTWISRGMEVQRKITKGIVKMAETEGEQYWQGEWICADCGYIYDRNENGGLFFEQQKAGYKCPQCGAPRRRFAKKAGGTVGITGDGGDAPILIFSALGAIAVIALGIWAAGQ